MSNKGVTLAKLFLLLGLATTAASGAVLFEDDFARCAPDRRGAPVWRLQGGTARLTAEGMELSDSKGEAFTLEGLAAGDAAWRDYTLSFEVKQASCGNDWRDGVWAAVRCTPAPNMYVIGFYPGKVWLNKIVIGVSVSDNKPLAEAGYPAAGLSDGKWHQVRISVVANRIGVALDGALLFEAEDNNPEHLAPLRAGAIMFGARRSSLSATPTVATVRNVKVTRPDDVAVPAATAFDKALARSIQPWTEREKWPLFDDIAATLDGWSRTRADRMTLETVGHSLEGLPILAAVVTDTGVPNDNKHTVLVTAFDSGGERSGTCGVLQSMEWLLGDTSLAKKARKHHEVVFMPIPNPYGYVNGLPTNSKKINPYHGGRGRSDHWDLKMIEVKNPADAPHLVAITKVVDRYQPEFHFDLHGVGMKYAGQLVQPSIGSAYSNISNRPWDWRLLETLIRYANRAGHGYNRMEADAQQVFFSEGMESYSKRYWMGRPFFYTANYGYIKYHTMPCTVEVGWPEGAVEVVKGLLDFGNRQFADSPVPGFPVNRAVYQVGNEAVCAYGATAAERRRSRVELWQRQEEIALGFAYPYTDGRVTVVCTLGEAGATALRGDKKGGTLNVHDFLRAARKLPGMDADALEAFSVAGPETTVYVGDWPKPPRDGTAFKPLQQGLAIEFPLFYRAPELLDLRLNGAPLPKDPLSGYQAWYSEWEGYTLVRVNVPPERAGAGNVFIVTCLYKPDTQRVYGWEAPIKAAPATK